jgi:hypothetical protein
MFEDQSLEATTSTTRNLQAYTDINI